MLKYLVLVLLIDFLNGQEALLNITATTPSAHIVNSTTVHVISTIINTTHHATIANSSISLVPNSSVVHHQANQPFLNTEVKQDMAKNSYSQYKLLVNSSQEVPIKTHAPSSLSLMVILISLVAVAFIIAGILTALFVMKRRFSILRINGSKGNDCSNDGANGMLTNGGSSSGSSSETASTHEKCIEINEKEKEALTSAVADTKNELVSVENPQAELPTPAATQDAVLVDLATTKEAEPEKKEAVVVEVESKPVEIVVAAEVVAAEGAVVEPVPAVVVEATTTVVTSSSSLIANVLNELSESVVSKLQGTVSEDPEKQPLNNADQ